MQTIAQQAARYGLSPAARLHPRISLRVLVRYSTTTLADWGLQFQRRISRRD